MFLSFRERGVNWGVYHAQMVLSMDDPSRVHRSRPFWRTHLASVADRTRIRDVAQPFGIRRPDDRRIRWRRGCLSRDGGTTWEPLRLPPGASLTTPAEPGRNVNRDGVPTSFIPERGDGPPMLSIPESQFMVSLR